MTLAPIARLQRDALASSAAARLWASARLRVPCRTIVNTCYLAVRPKVAGNMRTKARRRSLLSKKAKLRASVGFQHESGHEAIKFRPERLSGAPALDGFLLTLPVAYTLSAWRPEFGSRPSVFHSFQSRVELNPSRLRLGCPSPSIPFILTTHEHDQNATLVFEIQLPATAMERLEEARVGEGVELKMHLSCERIGARHAVQHDDVTYRVSQSEWIDVLKQMNYGNFLLCEIPIAIERNDDLDGVYATMTRARDLMYAGHYSNAVIECRKAFEATTKRFGVNTQSAARKYRGNSGERMSMSKRERILNLYGAANHATQFGAHPDPDNRAVEYSRKEALLIFTVIAASIADIAERDG